MSNSVDPDQTQFSVRPDLGSNCLQKGEQTNIGIQLIFSSPEHVVLKGELL